MTEHYSAGDVFVDIRPDTTLFWSELRGELAKRNPEVEIGFIPQTAEFYRTLERIDGKQATVDVEFKSDSRLLEKKFNELNNRSISPELDSRNLLKELDSVSDQLTQVRNKISWQKYWDKNEDGVREYNKLLEQSEKLHQRQSDLLHSELASRTSELNDLQNAILRVKPLGADNVLDNRTATEIRRRYKALADDIEDNPAKVRLALDDTDYAKVTKALRETLENIRETNRTEARVRFYEEGADAIERRLNELSRRRVIPVELKAEQESLINDLRSVAEKVRNDSDFVYEANLDLQMKRAEERIRDFKNDNDKLSMDLDLNTALASAHMAYFTRPRTVDVFAEFKGTDLGKLLRGMTSGATGLDGVTNQWQKFIRMFDSLDEVVPKLSLMGAALTALGAGSLNVGRTIGGVGTSIVSLSKAALAAPAVLGALAAAGYGVYAAYQTAGDQFDVTATQLAGLKSEVGGAFWEEARQPLYDLANNIAPTLTEGLSGVAGAEGKVVAGLADIALQSDKVGELPHIFENAQRAVSDLDPGLQSLLKAFLSLGDSTSDYLPRMSGYLSDVSGRFAEWVEEAERTGRIEDSLEGVIEQGGYLKSSFESLTGIIKGTFGTLAAQENGIQGFSEALEKADDAVNSVRFQETLEAWSDGAQRAQDNMRGSLGSIGDAMYELKDTTADVFADSGAIVGAVAEGISGALEQSSDGIRDFSGGVRNGFEDVFDAVDDAGPMFNDLLSMVGSLSRTFGGTFASTLRAAAPLLSSMANGAEAVAKAFDALPDPVKATLGLYVTFGKTGRSALDSVKQGLLTNIQQTLQYRKTMSELGVTVSSSSVSFRELASAWAAMKTGDYPGMFATVKNGASSAGSALESAGVKATGFKGAMQSAGNMAKTAGATLLDAFGGAQGLLITGAISAIALAWSDYNERAAETERANQRVVDSMSDLDYSAENAAESVKNAKKEIGENWGNDEYQSGGWDWLTDIVTGFDNAKEAAEKLGISTSDLTDAATGTNEQYSKMVDKLKEMSEQTTLATGQYGVVTQQQTETAKAAGVVLEALQAQREDGWEPAEEAIREYLKSADLVNDMADDLDSSISDLTKSFEANGDTLDETTAGGQRNKQMIEDLANEAKLAAIKMLAYGEANGKTEEYTQKAVNAIYDARQAVIKAGEAAGMSAEDAAAFADSLGLIPSDVGTTITADTTLAKGQIDTYLQSLALTEGQRDIILNLVDNGVIDDLRTLDGVIDTIMGGKVSTKTLTLLLNADGDALWKTENVEKNLEALGMSKKTYEWLLSGKGNAEERMEKVRDALSYLNLTDEQIQWILDCIDHASGKLEDIEKQKVPAAKGVSFDITANPDQANAVLASLEPMTINPKTVFIGGDDSVARAVMAGIEATDGTTLAYPWARVMGDDSIARAIFAGIQAYDQTTISRPWGRVLGENNGARQAFDDTSWYDGRTISKPWGRVLGDDSNVRDVYQSIQSRNGWVLATRYVDIVTREKVQAATGGRISGPGTGTSDSVPAMLSNGEMVIKAASVRKLDATYGTGFLNALNDTGRVNLAAQSRIIANNLASSMQTEFKTLNMQSDGGATSSKTSGSHGGRVVNQTFIYPTVTPIPVKRNERLDQYANLGLI